MHKYIFAFDVATILPDNSPQIIRLRNGGYTRIVRIGHRYGDAADRAIIEFIDRYAYNRLGIYK